MPLVITYSFSIRVRSSICLFLLPAMYTWVYCVACLSEDVAQSNSITVQLVFAFISIEELAADWAVIILIFALYCFSSIPLVYLFSFFFSVPSAAMVRITILMIITGMISIISITLLRVMAPAIPGEHFQGRARRNLVNVVEDQVHGRQEDSFQQSPPVDFYKNFSRRAQKW